NARVVKRGPVLPTEAGGMTRLVVCKDQSAESLMKSGALTKFKTCVEATAEIAIGALAVWLVMANSVAVTTLSCGSDRSLSVTLHRFALIFLASNGPT